jgi:hypothetical protein
VSIQISQKLFDNRPIPVSGVSENVGALAKDLAKPKIPPLDSGWSAFSPFRREESLIY